MSEQKLHFCFEHSVDLLKLEQPLLFKQKWGVDYHNTSAHNELFSRHLAGVHILLSLLAISRAGITLPATTPRNLESMPLLLPRDIDYVSTFKLALIWLLQQFWNSGKSHSCVFDCRNHNLGSLICDTNSVNSSLHINLHPFSTRWH